jgi:hypothetical protein
MPHHIRAQQLKKEIMGVLKQKDPNHDFENDFAINNIVEAISVGLKRHLKHSNSKLEYLLSLVDLLNHAPSGFIDKEAYQSVIQAIFNELQIKAQQNK